MNKHLPPDVLAAANKAKETNYNEEDLAVITLCELIGGANLREDEELQRLFHLLDESSPADHLLLCDLEWTKQLGNSAFSAHDWMEALQHYASIFKALNLINSRSRHEPFMPDAVTDLLATTHANAAQTLLNLARNDEAAKQCQAALKIPGLFDKPKLHQKVLHRLESCQKPPTVQARLASEEAARRPSPMVKITDDDVNYVLHMSRLDQCGEEKLQASPKEIAKYALQMAQGDKVLAGSWIRSCHDASFRFEWCVRLIRETALQRGIVRRIAEEEVERLFDMLGRGPSLRKIRKKRAAAKARSEEMLEKVVEQCETAVWRECLNENATLTQAILAQSLEWIRTRDPQRALVFFLAAADKIAQVDSEKVSPNTKRVYQGRGEMDLRAIVEMAWLAYVSALAVIDFTETDTSEAPKWKDIEFCRMQHVLMLANGKVEPPEKAELNLDKAVASAMESKSVDEKASAEVPSRTAKARAPSLADYSAFTMKRQAELEATKRGIEKLQKALRDATGEDGKVEYGFSSYRWAAKHTFDRTKKLVFEELKDKEGNLPIVDDIWHIGVHKSQGIRPEMMTIAPSGFDEFRPGCVFVANKKVPTPPKSSEFSHLSGPFACSDTKVLPRSTVATVYFNDDMRDDHDTVDQVFKVLVRAVETRGGCPKQIAFGPIGTMALMMPYLDFDGGGPAPDVSVDDIHGVESWQSRILARSELEAFVEDDLGVKYQWFEGWWGDLPQNRSNEERPKKRTPAQYRAEHVAKLNWESERSS